MELTIANSLFKSKQIKKQSKIEPHHPNLTQADINFPYIIKGINTHEKDMKEFLFTLGCYEGEKVTVISVLAENYVINMKDARYSIDQDLAKAILI